MCASGSGPGADHASQRESGENARSWASPFSTRDTSCSCPVAASSVNTRLSSDAIASTAPSGDATNASTVPSSPSANRVPEAGSPSPAGPPTAGTVPAPTGAICTESSPPASVTQATRPVAPSTTGIRARAPGVAASTRTGPSRCGSHCTVPRSSTTLARPVRSGAVVPRFPSAAMRCGARPVRWPPSRTASGSGAAPAAGSRSASDHSDPAEVHTTRVPSLEACRT